MILITGTGRSGTKYITQVLQRCGLLINHEKLGKDGIVSSVWTVEDKVYPSYHQQGPQPKFNIILHQVRNPLSTIGSITTALPESWQFLYRHIPINPKDNVLKRSAEYWYYWNLLAEKRSIWTYRIEDLENIWETFCNYLNINCEYEKIKYLSREINARKHKDYSWEDIKNITPLYDKIRSLAERYGY